MDISVTYNNLSTQATTAYYNFKSCQIPFAAVKLNVCLQNISKKEIDEIIEDNFRSEKDLIFKEDQKYFILMERTTIEAAEGAVGRLKAKMGHIIRNCENLEDNSHNHATAYIFGSSKGTKRIHIKYLDLNFNFNSFNRKNPNITFGYGEYLKWLQSPKTESLKINQMINVVV